MVKVLLCIVIGLLILGCIFALISAISTIKAYMNIIQALKQIRDTSRQVQALKSSIKAIESFDDIDVNSPEIKGS